MQKKTKIALVTGGVGGIGSAICTELADIGCRVVAGYFAPSEQEVAEKWLAKMKSKGYDFEIAGSDVSDYDSSKAMIVDIEKRVGPIDILVNCAGITKDRTLKKMPPEAWRAVISTNLDSVFNMTQPLILGMKERGFGRVINIASVNGQKGQFGQANYSAAKAGMHGFTMAVAQEAARKGVTVNTVSPGYISTPMTDALPDKVLDAIVSQIPMSRMGQPEEIAHAVSWLVDERSSYITGANIPVNGGMFMSS